MTTERYQTPQRPVYQASNARLGALEPRRIVSVEDALADGLPDVLGDLLQHANGAPSHLRQFGHDVKRGDGRYRWRSLAKMVELSTFAACATAAQALPEYLRSLIIARHAARVQMGADLFAAFMEEEDANHGQNKATVEFIAGPSRESKASLIHATLHQAHVSRKLADVLHQS